MLVSRATSAPLDTVWWIGWPVSMWSARGPLPPAASKAPALWTGGSAPTTSPYLNARVLQNTSTLANDGMFINYDSSGGTNAKLRFYVGGTTLRMTIAGNG